MTMEGLMASITKQRTIDTSPGPAWDALRDWEGLQQRLVQGFVIDTSIQDGDRILTFSNGMVARERLVACDEEALRLVWTVVDGPFSHYNAAAQVLPAEHGRTRFVWTLDLLPNEMAGAVEAMMDDGIAAIERTLAAGHH
jgi:hypothetical protein